MPDFLPRREADLVTWTLAFRDSVVADPAAFGLSAQEAAEYAALQRDFALTYRRSQDPATRTPVAVRAKDSALKALKRKTRQLAWRVRGTKGMDAGRLARLGMKLPSRNRRALPAPHSAPRLSIIPTLSNDVVLKIEDRERLGKARPSGVAGAVVMIYVGDAPPADLMDWTFGFGTTKTRLSASLPKGHSPGTRVWYTAWWQSPTGKRGPASVPVCTRVGFDRAPLMATLAA